jgi:hypothetical protein
MDRVQTAVLRRLSILPSLTPRRSIQCWLRVDTIWTPSWLTMKYIFAHRVIWFHHQNIIVVFQQILLWHGASTHPGKRCIAGLNRCETTCGGERS